MSENPLAAREDLVLIENASSGGKSGANQNRRILIGSVTLVLIIAGTLLGFILWPTEPVPSPLAGDWMQGNGEVYTIEADGSGSNPSCMPKWTIDGNETTHSEDCTRHSPDGEPLWSERIYSFEFVGDVREFDLVIERRLHQSVQCVDGAQLVLPLLLPVAHHRLIVESADVARHLVLMFSFCDDLSTCLRASRPCVSL